MKRVLIVKYGALGDVVRTSYFAKPIKLSQKNIELNWLTSPASREILRHNPFIDNIFTDINGLTDMEFDVIYSLDDEINIVKEVFNLKTRRLCGAYFESGIVRYTDDAAEWFDMGIHSLFGIDYANQLKRDNVKTHTEIFSKIFSVNFVDRNFYFSKQPKLVGNSSNHILIGLFPHSGGRWPSKSMRNEECISLISKIINGDHNEDISEIRLYGVDEEMRLNYQIYESIGDPKIKVINSEGSIESLSENIRGLDIMISSDSLPLHLAISNDVYVISYFTATSAAEIDLFGNGCKIISTAHDYCSYKKDADNKTITADIIYKTLNKRINHLKLSKLCD